MAKKKKKLVQVMLETLDKISPTSLSARKKVRVAAVFLLMAAVGVIVAMQASFKADTLSGMPEVTIVSPKAGQTAANTLKIQASASDNIKINKMVLYIDDQVTYEVYNDSLTYLWDTTDGEVVSGKHKIRVRAYDNEENSSAKELVIVK